MKKTMKELWDVVQNQSELKKDFDPPSRAIKGTKGYMVYLTFGSAEERSIVTSGFDSVYSNAVQKAYQAYWQEEKTPPVSLKMDVITKINDANKKVFFTKEDERINLRAGRDGIMLHEHPEYVFLPEEVQAYDLMQKGRLQEESIRAAQKKKLPSPHTEDIFDAPAKVDIIRTTTAYIDKSGYYALTGGKRKFTSLSKKSLEQSLNLTKDYYFKRAVGADGRITYAYYPATDEEAEGYNILRHAGTVYSMLELYEWSKDEEILAAAERALEYLISFLRPHKVNDVEVNVIVENDTFKLGGNGLAVVAFAKYTEVTGNQKYVPVMQSLATWMAELQRNEERFSVHKQKYSTGEVKDFESEYYPGEAILAMVRLYKVDAQSKWLDCAEKEARYLIEVRDRTADKETIPHDHWLLYGLYDLYQFRPHPLYSTHAFFIADTITEAQLLDPDTVSREMQGSYKIKANYPRSTPAATRSEGLGAAAKLAELIEDSDRAKRYRYSIHQAIKYQLQMQLYPESVLYFPNKSFILGGFRGSLREWELRNDYTQHNVSSILSYLELIESMERSEKVALGLSKEK